MSSSELALAVSPPAAEARPAGLELLADVVCPVNVILGTGRVTVRDVLTLQPGTVLRLRQSAGADLQVLVNDVPLARGEVVVVEDSTGLRITEIVRPAAQGDAR